MAAQFIRYLVSHLEDCLKRALRADMILNMNHGLPLAYFYYLITVPSAAEKRSYQKLVPHKWTRAIFVCKKSKEFVPVALLDAGGYLPTLASFWWRCHAYLLPKTGNSSKGLPPLSFHTVAIGFRTRWWRLSKP